ncbi:PaaI family thioesterase [Patulibacter americanus]|uniref:PaaI family thioesterase n=1 Tax=Patulibacter americanus TaxID=588672 RepID=UPI0003B305C4|nr:PaaI family thioesterase [Patulibacter americanus]
MTSSSPVPDGFAPLPDAGAFVDHVGPVFVREADGVVGVRVEDRHLNAAGTAMGGFLATLVDVSIGRAVRANADGEAAVATVSLTTDYLKPGPAGAWLEARCEVERLGGSLAFVDCSLRADDDEIVRARAVFAVRTED